METDAEHEPKRGKLKNTFTAPLTLLSIYRYK